MEPQKTDMKKEEPLVRAPPPAAQQVVPPPQQGMAPQAAKGGPPAPPPPPGPAPAPGAPAWARKPIPAPTGKAEKELMPYQVPAAPVPYPIQNPPIYSPVIKGGKKKKKENPNFVCWVRRVGGDLCNPEESKEEAERGLCGLCLQKFLYRNKFLIQKSKMIIFPIDVPFIKTIGKTKTFWYDFSLNEGKTTFKAREVFTGRKPGPLKVLFVQEEFKPEDHPGVEKLGVKNPIDNLYLAYKFGVRNFAMYRWYVKEEDVLINTQIKKTPKVAEHEDIVVTQAAKEGSGVHYIYADKDWIYYQDLEEKFEDTLQKHAQKEKRTPGRKRKVQPIVSPIVSVVPPKSTNENPPPRPEETEPKRQKQQ
mmetsp:Transcript_11302/g.13440  ORF Transcript_11302/g.13440 Transcript_11302/m.13440 type:complete len:363 (-) Transcript_11302:127-1215(-)|eukprot:jgi/Bigna1/87313/estExt_fgenesh1_pg.C_190036